MSKKTPSAKKKERKRITVYTSPSLKNEMKQYYQAMGYSGYSDMLRNAFRILKQFYPTEAIKSDVPTLEDRLIQIQKQLEDIQSKKDLKEKELENIKIQKNIFSKRRENLTSNKNDLSTTLNTIPETSIPNFESISQDILKFIKDYSPSAFEGVKEQILLGYFEKYYEVELIWVVLKKLKQKKIIALEEGLWTINAKGGAD